MRIGLTFDCHDAAAQARFWAVALDYEEAPPPEGWATWEQWLRDHDVPEEEWDDGASIHDPTGARPGVTFLRVPEPKTAKHRLHLDPGVPAALSGGGAQRGSRRTSWGGFWVSGGRHVDPGVREPLIRAKAEQLLALGASVIEEGLTPAGLDHYVLADPEGNEFCVA